MAHTIRTFYSFFYCCNGLNAWIRRTDQQTADCRKKRNSRMNDEESELLLLLHIILLGRGNLAADFVSWYTLLLLLPQFLAQAWSQLARRIGNENNNNNNKRTDTHKGRRENVDVDVVVEVEAVEVRYLFEGSARKERWSEVAAEAKIHNRWIRFLDA